MLVEYVEQAATQIASRKHFISATCRVDMQSIFISSSFHIRGAIKFAILQKHLEFAFEIALTIKIIMYT
jgi:hypothetical protein